MPGIKGMKRTKLHNQKIAMALRGRKLSVTHCKKISINAKKRLAIPQNNPNWKGDDVGYQGIHIWLRKNYGYPKMCELCQTPGERVKRQWSLSWALKKGCQYKRRRENFLPLCDKCHRKYDVTDRWNKNISKARMGKPTRPKGYSPSQETRNKISQTLKKRFLKPENL